MNKTIKKTILSSLAVIMLLGGATSVFADGKGRDKDKWDDRIYKADFKGKWNDDSDNDDDDNDEIEINLTFKDEKELKWALEHIMRLASKGVFTGYEDGSFKPLQKITRIEALVAAVRLMGLRAQAESAAEMSTKLNFKDADKLPKWAIGYVAVAVENDLFAETDTTVNPNKPADRLWAATLLVKAMKLSDEAKAKSNTELAFRDAEKIPAGSVGYVAVAVEKGLVTGYQDETFRPNQSVTRAELAALLDRTDSQIPDQAQDAQAVSGKLKAVVSNGAMTIVKADNTEVALPLDSNVFIFRNNIKSDVTALEANDTVLVRTFQGKVVFIEVTQNASAAVSFTETGVINSVSFNAQGKLATLSITKTVSGGTQAIIYNVAADVAIQGNASLTVGQTIEVKGANGTVSSIQVK
ncbi:S-layer protein [Paenibacillus darwinianus]|uniref:S-layer protein n=1 Tax=Paenibacillus darwinianus TaxID=1380763 RepID=A0A9W5W7F9_9BACL|nr:S-layer homology domain-containing protein [Paenibacillus darwinianus]EXX87401.1 S-layer protein [Paenibacillus darwinianus]EXX88099.1 S-layer protein [Paenibacillus darwinianus]EXX88688.1 S-layer protein [Paenibacillus darwinianus]